MTVVGLVEGSRVASLGEAWREGLWGVRGLRGAVGRGCEGMGVCERPGVLDGPWGGSL